MSLEERVAQLEAENAVLREQIGQLLRYVAENVVLREQVQRLQGRVAELDGQLAKESQHSSKPPSSDGLGRKPTRPRPTSEKKSGGQPGHVGHSLPMAQKADTIVRHGPSECVHCHQPLEAVAVQVIERRQVHDLPVWRVEVTEQQVEEVECPRCQQRNRGSFPAEVSAPAQ